MKLAGALRNWALAFIAPVPLVGIAGLPRYFQHWFRYRKMAGGVAASMHWRDSYPCLADWSTTTPFDPHYFYQGAWLARHLKRAAPVHHVDVGSSVLMLSVISAMVDTTFIDVRPLEARLDGLASKAGSIVALPFDADSVPSLSCLHVIEHIGLGRYNDPLDPEGSVKAARELARVLAPGGRLYLALPIGRARICFNAHRVHSPAEVAALFEGLDVIEFSCVGDDGEYRERVDPASAEHFDYGCGMYVFAKHAPALR